MSEIMLIRRDLDSIIRVMNRFNLTDESDRVTIHHTKTPSGYELNIDLNTTSNGLLAKVNVEIDQYIVCELNDLDEKDAQASMANPQE